MVPTVAYANFAIHGSYEMDTDACAGCHRAHTSASSIQWSDGADSGSALLLGEETDNYEFCYTCHDSVSQGADTNVETGIYEGDTYGEEGAMLNGGGFDTTLFPTTHLMDGTRWGAYGGGVDGSSGGDGADQAVGEGPKIAMTCSACHDVHGSTNYRLLKDVVNGVTVGTYNDTEGTLPEPFVISSEPGYPQVGWKLHEMGADQAAGYVPNYTKPMYAKAPDVDGDGNPDAEKGMSAWCAACHTQYVVETGTRVGTINTVPPTADYTDGYDAADGTINPDGVYDAGDGFGAEVRHRHPVNVPLSNFLGVRDVVTTANGNPLPLAYDAAVAGAEEAVTYNVADPFNTTTKTDVVGTSDWVDCMTCHVAHGSAVAMTGYANVDNALDPQADSGSLADGVGSVPPTQGNALLRMNDRAVCENCHNK